MKKNESRPGEWWGDQTEGDQRVTVTGTADDLLVVTIWTLVGIFGIITNSLTIAGICQNKKLRHSTSYWLVISLALCDIGMLIVCMAHLIPASILHDRFMEIVEFSNAFGVFIYDSFWYTGVLHLMIMAINRYVNICRHKYYLELFSPGKTARIIILLYFIGTALACPGLFPCCYLVFNYNFYAAQYEPADTPYRYVDMVINGCSASVMAFCYVAIIVRVRRSRIVLLQYRQFCREQTKNAFAYAKSTSNARRNSISAKLARILRAHAPISSRREVKLFFQFATVSMIFFLTFFTWSWLPHLSTDSKWIGFVVTSLFFINSVINPIVYFIFNTSLRRQIQKIMCPFQSVAKGPIDRQRGKEGSNNNQQATATCALQVSKPNKAPMSVLRRLRSSASMRQRKQEEKFAHSKRFRRRSTAFDPEDDARLLRTPVGSCNDTTENDTEANATCNLMAMAAFLNTTTITGGVLLRAIHEDEERKRGTWRQLFQVDDAVMNEGAAIGNIQTPASPKEDADICTRRDTSGQEAKQELIDLDDGAPHDELSVHL